MDPKTAKPYSPFSCSYTPNVPELLNRMGCSILLSTYQAGKVVILSATNDEKLMQLPRSFNKPMGIALHEDNERLAIAMKGEVTTFSNSRQLAHHYPKKPNTYDSMFMPRLTYHTGPLDIHDLSWGKDDKLYAVNTLFSCIVTLDDQYSFTPYWQPDFVTDLVSEDRCHLNGMTLQNGLPRYATAFNRGNTRQSWREKVVETGVLLNVATNDVICGGLGMPHSPRLINGDLYVLLSATGQLIKVNTRTGYYDIVSELGGFVRGMAYHQDLLFVGMSKLRKNSSTFAHLNIAGQSDVAGIKIIHLPTGSLVGQITYENSVDEIYDIQILPGKRRPNIHRSDSMGAEIGIATPEKTFWGSAPEC